MKLTDFFKNYKKAGLALSGGVDSAYLLYAARQSNKSIHAYFVKTPFQPDFELDTAKKLAEETNTPLTVLTPDILSCSDIASNPKDRCYHCKKAIFTAIITAAKADGCEVVLDGTNASDDADDRPGMRALAELHVKSPLRLCGITKKEVRRLAKEAGVFVWDRPAYACLATRIPEGTPITQEILKNTEAAENYLFSKGFEDFRIRYFNGAAKIQLRADDIKRFTDERKEHISVLKQYYNAVLLDMEVRDEH